MDELIDGVQGVEVGGELVRYCFLVLPQVGTLD